MHDPAYIFDQLFAGIGGNASAELLELRLRRRSVIDAVKASFNDLLTSGLNPSDKTRLSNHMDRIRDAEVQAIRSCTPDPQAAFERGDLTDDERFQRLRPLIALNFACGVAPVLTFEFKNSDSSYIGTPEYLAYTQGDFQGHELVHGDVSPITGLGRPDCGDGSDWELSGQHDPGLIELCRFYQDVLATIMTDLKQVVVGPSGETAFDETVGIHFTDLGEGKGHGANAMHLQIIGGALNGAKPRFHYNGSEFYGNPSDKPRFYDNDRYAPITAIWASFLKMCGVTEPDGSPPQFGMSGLPAQDRLPIDALFT